MCSIKLILRILYKNLLHFLFKLPLYYMEENNLNIALKNKESLSNSLIGHQCHFHMQTKKVYHKKS